MDILVSLGTVIAIVFGVGAGHFYGGHLIEGKLRRGLISQHGHVITVTPGRNAKPVATQGPYISA